MNSWSLILATVIIFGTGVITGGLLVDHVGRPHPKPAHAPANAPATNHPVLLRSDDFYNVHQPEIFKKDFFQKVADQLQLNPAQRDAVKNIIANGQSQNRALWDNWVAASREVSQRARLEIREQLTTEQRKQFELLLKQLRPLNRKQATNAVPAALPATNAPAAQATNTPSV